MNAKAKGARAELRCIKALEDRGWLCTRAGASLGAFDVIALMPSRDTAVFIQVKSGTNKLRRKERAALEALAPDSLSIFIQHWHWDRRWTTLEWYDKSTSQWVPMTLDS